MRSLQNGRIRSRAKSPTPLRPVCASRSKTRFLRPTTDCTGPVGASTRPTLAAVPSNPNCPGAQTPMSTKPERAQSVCTRRRAVAEVRARLEQAVAGRTSIIADLESRRVPGRQRLTELQAIRAELAASHETTTEGRRERTDRLASLVVPPPWPQAPPPELQAQQQALGGLRDAIADARSTLKAITAQGASLPPPPDPRAPHQPRDLSALRTAVVQAERAAREAEAQKAKMLAELAELRAPLAAEHRVLTDRKTRLDKTLQRFRKRRDAGRRRLEGLHNRQATVQDALQKVQPEALDLITEPTAARDAAVNALETATAILQQRTTAERVLRETPPAASADPAPAQEATATARLLVEMCTAPCATSSPASVSPLTWPASQRSATQARRTRSQLDQARTRREAVVAEHAALTQDRPIRAKIDALQPAQQPDNPEPGAVATGSHGSKRGSERPGGSRQPSWCARSTHRLAGPTRKAHPQNARRKQPQSRDDERPLEDRGQARPGPSRCDRSIGWRLSEHVPRASCRHSAAADKPWSERAKPGPTGVLPSARFSAPKSPSNRVFARG